MKAPIAPQAARENVPGRMRSGATGVRTRLQTTLEDVNEPDKTRALIAESKVNRGAAN